MSKKRNENSFWNNGPDSELIARFTGFLKQVLLNERSTYLKNLKKKELMECSFEEPEEKRAVSKSVCRGRNRKHSDMGGYQKSH